MDVQPHICPAGLAGVYRNLADRQFLIDGTPKVSTAADCCRAFLRIAKFGNCRFASDVSGDVVAAYVADYVARRGGDKRARASAWSSVSSARAVFAKWVLPHYAKMSLLVPDVASWPKPRFSSANKYQRPSAVLRLAVKRWFARLDETEPDLFNGAALLLQFAMRPVDAARLEWGAFPIEGGRRVLRYVPSKTEGRTARPRVVLWPCDEALFVKMRRLGGEVFVLPQSSPNERLDSIRRSISRRMRALGFSADVYSKASYELRKLCVDAVYRRFGLEKACQISGDDPQTVMSYYADPNVDGIEPLDVCSIL